MPASERDVEDPWWVGVDVLAHRHDRPYLCVGHAAGHGGELLAAQVEPRGGAGLAGEFAGSLTAELLKVRPGGSSKPFIPSSSLAPERQ